MLFWTRLSVSYDLRGFYYFAIFSRQRVPLLGIKINIHTFIHINMDVRIWFWRHFQKFFLEITEKVRESLNHAQKCTKYSYSNTSQRSFHLSVKLVHIARYTDVGLRLKHGPFAVLCCLLPFKLRKKIYLYT